MTFNAPTVLLVEDEVLIQDLMEQAFVEAGFAVVVVGGGAEAIARLGEDGAGFRAVITDVRLGPGPDGWDVARRAREVLDAAPIIYMTGDSAHDWNIKGVPGSVIVTKPFVPMQVLTALATLLAEADARAAS